MRSTWLSADHAEALQSLHTTRVELMLRASGLR